MKAPSSPCHPERSRGICGPLLHNQTLDGSAVLPLSSRAKPRDLRSSTPQSNFRWKRRPPLVIPSEAEGSAVLYSTIEFRWKRGPPLCHPERSRGICGPLLHNQTLDGSAVLPLSSRAKPRDLQFYGPVLGMFFDRSVRMSPHPSTSRRQHPRI